MHINILRHKVLQYFLNGLITIQYYCNFKQLQYAECIYKLYWDILFLLALPFLANVVAGWWQMRRPLVFVAVPENVIAVWCF